MGVAVRRYYTSPRTNDDYLESWLELWDGPPGADDAKLLPGYGWIFGMGDGIGQRRAGRAQHQRRIPEDQLPHPADQLAGRARPRNGACARRTRIGATQGAGLPMGFNRTPHYRNGVLLVGDSGGSVNPFNGEGIPYAMESGKLAAEATIQALARAGWSGPRAGAARLSRRRWRPSGAPTTGWAASS